MKRFFTTLFLLSGVAFSLILTDSFFKRENRNFTAENTNDFERSIDLSSSDIYDLNQNKSQVSIIN